MTDFTVEYEGTPNQANSNAVVCTVTVGPRTFMGTGPSRALAAHAAADDFRAAVFAFSQD